MGRPREHNPEEVRMAALKCFWKFGYDATSMSMLQEATGVDKKQLIRDYESKKGLFTRVFKEYLEVAGCMFLTSLESPSSGLKDIRGALRKVAARVELPDGRLGCLLCNTLSQASIMGDPGIATITSAYIKRVELAYRLALENAQEKGEISLSQAKLRRLSRSLMSTHFAILMLLRAGATKDVLKDVVEQSLSGIS